MSEENGFVRRHVAALQAELDRLRAVLAGIDDGAMIHQDSGKFRADVTATIAAYERSLEMWAVDLGKTGR